MTAQILLIFFQLILHAFLSFADFLLNNILHQKISRIPSVSNNFDPDRARQYVSSVLGLNGFQRLSATVNKQNSPLAGKELIT